MIFLRRFSLVFLSFGRRRKEIMNKRSSSKWGIEYRLKREVGLWRANSRKTRSGYLALMMRWQKSEGGSLFWRQFDNCKKKFS